VSRVTVVQPSATQALAADSRAAPPRG